MAGLRGRACTLTDIPGPEASAAEVVPTRIALVSWPYQIAYEWCPLQGSGCAARVLALHSAFSNLTEAVEAVFRPSASRETAWYLDFCRLSRQS